MTGDWHTGTEGSFEYYPVFSYNNRCPVAIVRPGERIFASGMIMGRITYDGGTPTQQAVLQVKNSAGGGLAGDVYTFDRPSVDYITADPFLEYPAATGTGHFNDSDVLWLNIRDQCCALLSEHLGRIDLLITYVPAGPLRVEITGDSLPLGGTSHVWRASSSSGGWPHQLNWYRDGQWVGGGTSYDGNAGTQDFALRVDATDVYGRTASKELYIDVDGVLPSITGPFQIWASQGGGTWNARGEGGIPPYTFDWYINDAWVAQGPSFTGYNRGQAGFFELRATMTDSRGVSASATQRVDQMGTGSDGCDPQPGADEC